MAPIHTAARSGNLNRVKAFLNQGVHVNSRNAYGYTPLHTAAQAGRLNVVHELLRRGAHVNPRNHRGITPLQWASSHPRVIHALIKGGANPRYKNKYGFDASTYSLKGGNAVRASSAATKWQNFRKKSIARKRAPKKNLAEKVFSSKHVGAMTAKYGFNWLNKV